MYFPLGRSKSLNDFLKTSSVITVIESSSLCLSFPASSKIVNNKLTGVGSVPKLSNVTTTLNSSEDCIKASSNERVISNSCAGPVGVEGIGAGPGPGDGA